MGVHARPAAMIVRIRPVMMEKFGLRKKRRESMQKASWES